MILRRIVQPVALVTIGDKVSGLRKPRWHSLLWNIGPESFQTAMDELAENPAKARPLYAAEIVVGTWLSTRLTPENPALVGTNPMRATHLNDVVVPPPTGASRVGYLPPDANQINKAWISTLVHQRVR